MDVLMPKVGLTMTEGTVVHWHKREGDRVRKGEPLFTFETEKSTLDYEAPASGTLSRILVAEGCTVPCLTPVALLEDIVDACERSEAPLRRPCSPRARMRAKALGVDLNQVVGSGPGGAIRERDVLAAAQPAARATPLAKRLAEELGISLSEVAGSGPSGRITREDVARAAQAQRAAAEPAADPPRVHPLTPAQRVTAQRLAANAQAAPHVTLFTEADATHLVAAREQLSAELNEKVSYSALFIAICARALKEHPHVNASWAAQLPDRPDQPGVVWHSAIHIGIAVDTPEGLLVPVLRDAGAKSLAQIHRESADLVARALSGQLQPDELRGSTFTITNLGMFEVDGFTPILNLPEAAILGIGRLAKKPAVLEDGSIAARTLLTLSLTFDHRVMDGAPAARFLQRVKQLVERPFALLL
jgi:pyruvate dehydrogenase E2 component (dihydrolipoamide acetyltransferase)